MHEHALQFLGRVYWQKKMDRFKESRDQITEEQTGAGARAVEKDRQLRARQKRYAQVCFLTTAVCNMHTDTSECIHIRISTCAYYVYATCVYLYFTLCGSVCMSFRHTLLSASHLIHTCICLTRLSLKGYIAYVMMFISLYMSVIYCTIAHACIHTGNACSSSSKHCSYRSSIGYQEKNG
jgi:hypothetical protein